MKFPYQAEVTSCRLISLPSSHLPSSWIWKIVFGTRNDINKFLFSLLPALLCHVSTYWIKRLKFWSLMEKSRSYTQRADISSRKRFQIEPEFPFPAGKWKLWRSLRSKGSVCNARARHYHAADRKYNLGVQLTSDNLNKFVSDFHLQGCPSRKEDACLCMKLKALFIMRTISLMIRAAPYSKRERKRFSWAWGFFHNFKFRYELPASHFCSVE